MDVDTMNSDTWFAQIFGKRISAPAQPNDRPFRATQNPRRRHKHPIGKRMGTFRADYNSIESQFSLRLVMQKYNSF